jgi:hypothetical protein
MVGKMTDDEVNLYKELQDSVRKYTDSHNFDFKILVHHCAINLFATILSLETNEPGTIDFSKLKKYLEAQLQKTQDMSGKGFTNAV